MPQNKLSKFALAALVAVSFVSPVLAAGRAEEGVASAAILMFTMLISCIALIIPLIFFLGYLFNIACIVDATQRDFGEDKSQLILWIFVLLIAGFPLGTILYYLLAVKKFPKKK